MSSNKCGAKWALSSTVNVLQTVYLTCAVCDSKYKWRLVSLNKIWLWSSAMEIEQVGLLLSYMYVLYMILIFAIHSLHRSKHYTVKLKLNDKQYTNSMALFCAHDTMCLICRHSTEWIYCIYSIVEFISEMLVNNTNAEMTMTHWNCQCTNELWMWLLWAMHIMFISRQDSIQYIEHSSYEQSLFVAAAINNNWCSVSEW